VTVVVESARNNGSLFARCSLGALLGVLGCSHPAATAASTSEAAVIANGVQRNGVQLNGLQLHGRETWFDGVAYEGARLPDGERATLILDRGVLSARSEGVTLSGADLIGTHVSGLLRRLRVLDLRIDDAAYDSEPGNQDVLLYTVSLQVGDTSVPLCGLDQKGQPVPAVAVAGLWNYQQGTRDGGAHIDDRRAFTFGCVSAAIGKCVRMGYKPWALDKSCDSDRCVTLESFHQACTRMVRADYCGDGVSHTIDGTIIDVYDARGIQVDTEPTWYFEAEWDPGRARCVAHQRVVDMTTVPACAAELIDPTCGDLSHFDNGTLIMNRYKNAPTAK
jgi:hypothetical protein